MAGTRDAVEFCCIIVTRVVLIPIIYTGSTHRVPFDFSVGVAESLKLFKLLPPFLQPFDPARIGLIYFTIPHPTPFFLLAYQIFKISPSIDSVISWKTGTINGTLY